MPTILLSFLTLVASAESRDFDAHKIKKLAVENTSGKIVVAATEGPTATVAFEKKKFSESCKMSVEMQNDTLVAIVARGGSILVKEDCEVDFKISVPKKTDLDVKVGSGSISTNGTEGALLCRIGSGTLKAEGSFAEVKCDAGSGGLEINGLRGGAALAAGSGPIRARFLQMPLKGTLDIRTGSGSATVILPKGARVKTTLQAGSGSVHNDVADDPQAGYRVSMRAGSGDLSLKTE